MNYFVIFILKINMPFELVNNAFSFCFAKIFLTIFLVYSFIWTSSFA